MTKITELFKVEYGARHLDVFFSYVSHVFMGIQPTPPISVTPPWFRPCFCWSRFTQKKNKTSGSESAMPACVGLPGNCCGGGAWLVRICLNQYLIMWVLLMIYLSILMILYDVFFTNGSSGVF
jgi:hypothetical protein